MKKKCEVQMVKLVFLIMKWVCRWVQEGAGGECTHFKGGGEINALPRIGDCNYKVKVKYVLSL